MKKSAFKVIELFVYAVLVAAAIYYAIGHGGFNAPSATPTAAPTPAIEERARTEEKHTGEPMNAPSHAPHVSATPPYIPPPRGEFSP